MRKILDIAKRAFWWHALYVAVALEKKETARKIIYKLDEMITWQDFRSYKGCPAMLHFMYNPEIRFLVVKTKSGFPMGFNL